MLDSMRGKESNQQAMFSLLSPEKRVPAAHPLRGIKELVEQALTAMDGTFEAMYSRRGRSSIPPEQLLKSMLLMALFSVRSERLFCEMLDYNLLYRWFLNMSMDEQSFHPTTFSKNRDRFLEHDISYELFAEVVRSAKNADLLSDSHFTVDGTLIDAWASHKSFRPKDESPDERDTPDDPSNPDVDFRGQKRSNKTHASTTDPESRMARKSKGKEAKLSYSAHALMENRHGLLVDFRIDTADGFAERLNAVSMLEDNVPGSQRLTLGADRGYDDRSFVDACRARNITPHVAQKLDAPGGSAIDKRTTRHDGYRVSLRIRKQVEEVFGWMKTVGGFRRTRLRGMARSQMAAYVVGAAYNLRRLVNIFACRSQ